MAKTFTPKTPEQIEKELNELTDQALSKINEFFTSKEALQEHLRFLSQFHNFSVRNSMLIDKQFKGAKAVGSFAFWRSKGVSVKKGEKGIKILVPTPVEFFKRDNKTVQLKHATKQEKALIDAGQIKTSRKTFFKVGHVFDYLQTNAREKGLEVSEIFGQFQINQNVENAPAFMKAFEKVAENVGVTLLDKPFNELGTAKGAFYPAYNAIGLNPRNTEAENVQVMIHELAHAALHNQERNEQRARPLTTPEKEFQAELTAYTVAARYGIDVENFSVPYLANWTENATLEDKEQLISEVKETASKFIKIMDAELEKQLTQDKEKELTKIGFVEYGTLSQASYKEVEPSQLQAEISLLLENHSQKDAYMEQLQPIFESEHVTSEQLQQLNKILEDHVHVFDPEAIKEPQVLIKWSEHHEFEDNTMYRFAEANDKVGDIAFQQSLEDGYFKTRYSVLVPDENGAISLIQTDRLDLGDGEFRDILHQLYYEQRHYAGNQTTQEQLNILEEDVKLYHQKEKGELLLSEMKGFEPANAYEKTALKEAEKIEAMYGKNLPHPIMKVHGFADYREFGEANNADFPESKQKFDYTVAYPLGNDVKVVTGTFNRTQTISPLHDLEKFEKLPRNELNLLSENWHNHLQREEDKYLQVVVPRLKKEVKKHEKAYEMER